MQAEQNKMFYCSGGRRPVITLPQWSAVSPSYSFTVLPNSPDSIFQIRLTLILWACIPECPDCWKVIALLLNWTSCEQSHSTKTSIHFQYLELSGSSTKKTTRGWMLNSHYFAGSDWEILWDQILSILCSILRKICLIDHLLCCVPPKSF